MKVITVITAVFLIPYFAVVLLLAAGTAIFLFSSWLIRRLWNMAFFSTLKNDRQTLVILGTGWGSYLTLLNLNCDLYDVVVISPRNHFLFTPLLCSTTVGTLESRTVIEPVYSTCFGNNYRFILGEAVDIDFKARKITCRCSYTGNDIFISFDRLVIGVGAITNTFGVSGVEEHSFFLKEAADARNIRRKILANIQQARQCDVDKDTRQRLLHFVVVGGGPTGIEFSAELFDFLMQDARALFGNIISEAKITIVERYDILAPFSRKLQKYVENVFEKRPFVEVVKSTVTAVLPNGVILSDGSSISCELVVWSGGVIQRPFTLALALPKNANGQICVDKHLSVSDESLKHRVYALGDCAQIENNALQLTAQVAFQQGQYLAWLLNSSNGADFETVLRNFPSFSFRSLGMLAYVGNYRAIANLEGLPIANMQLTGVPASVLWHLAYLFRLLSWRQRIQVPTDWFKSAVFGRDISKI